MTREIHVADPTLNGSVATNTTQFKNAPFGSVACKSAPAARKQRQSSRSVAYAKLLWCAAPYRCTPTIAVSPPSMGSVAPVM